MADKQTFPRITLKSWWDLRKKFNQSIPGVVTASYIATVLNMKESSARSNVLPHLERLGIIDESGKTLDRARQWRDDAEYPAVCAAMRSEVYPQELFDAVPNPSEDRTAASRWFARATGAGNNAVEKMVKVYVLLSEGDPSKESVTREKSHQPRTSTKRKPSPTERKNKTTSDRSIGSVVSQTEPSLNINLQIHISSDATPDQIDQIFSSMAKHIYRQE